MAGKVPTFDELMNPLLRAMQALGGSGSVEEIYDKVSKLNDFRMMLWRNRTTRKKAIRPS
jgi:hypothetical protein